MDLKQIKELMAAMGRAGIKKLSIKEKTGYELSLERHEEQPQPQPHGFIHRYEEPQVRFGAPAHPSSPQRQIVSEETPAAEESKIEGKYVVSPMVGTFYSAASPDDPSFVKAGDIVDENTVVCIIEAMKVMNEVKAGMSGKIVEICVENGHPVEFGTKLFRIV